MTCYGCRTVSQRAGCPSQDGARQPRPHGREEEGAAPAPTAENQGKPGLWQGLVGLTDDVCPPTGLLLRDRLALPGSVSRPRCRGLNSTSRTMPKS